MHVTAPKQVTVPFIAKYDNKVANCHLVEYSSTITPTNMDVSFDR